MPGTEERARRHRTGARNLPAHLKQKQLKSVSDDKSKKLKLSAG